MADFKYIDIQFLDKTHTIKELSFVEFKNFLKRIYGSTDIIITFNELIAHCYKGDNKLNYVEKILVLLNIRGLIFGNEVTFVQNERNIVINIQEIIDSLLQEEDADKVSKPKVSTKAKKKKKKKN